MKNLIKLSILALILVFATKIEAQTKYVIDDFKSDNFYIYGLVHKNGKTLSSAEQKMFDQINLLRTNPKGYISIVDEFIQTETTRIDNYIKTIDPRNTSLIQITKKRFLESVQKLKDNLKTMSSVPPLQFHDCIYEVTKAHAIAQSKSGNIKEVAKNMTLKPYQRIKAKCPSSFPEMIHITEKEERKNGGEVILSDVFYNKSVEEMEIIPTKRVFGNFLLNNFDAKKILQLMDPHYTHMAISQSNIITEDNGENSGDVYYIINLATHISNSKKPKPLPPGCPQTATNLSLWPTKTVDGKEVSQECFDYHYAKMNN